MPDKYVEPYRAYNFKLQFGKTTPEAHFTECSGLGVKVQPILYRGGGEGSIVHHLPGLVEYAEVTLRYGLTDSSTLWDWIMKTAQGQVEYRNVSIILLDVAGTNEVLRWDLIGAWPSQWQGTLLNAQAREAAIESLTLVYDELKRT